MAKILVLAKSGFGKALKNGTGVLTPNGYVPIEDSYVGMDIINSDGNISKVTGVFPQEGLHKVYNVCFNDGTKIPCNASHLWTIYKYIKGIKTPITVTTSDLYNLKLNNKLIIIYDRCKNNSSYKEYKYLDVKIPNAINYSKKDFKIDPFTLGVLLGDGCFQDSITITLNNKDIDVINKLVIPEECAIVKQEIKENINSSTFRFSKNTGRTNKLKEYLSYYGLNNKLSIEKFIPEDYFYGSIEQRKALLEGLILTDGYNSTNTYIEYSTSSEQLCKDVIRLARELGIHVKCTGRFPIFTYNNESKIGAYNYRVYINYRRKYKHIIDIEETNEQAEMTCIKVDSKDSLFITEGYTLTHNTTSYCGRKKFNIKGLNPKETYIIQCVGRALPNPEFKLTKSNEIKDLNTGNRIQVDSISGMDRFKRVADIVNCLKASPYKNIIIDDFNYLSQDYYMANAMKGGWQTPKDIGYGMGLIFNSFEGFPENKNLILLAHYEEYKDKNGDSISYRFKSIGSMTDGYITPEGKVDIVLYGKTVWNSESKQANKIFVKEFDGEYPAKDSLGALDDLPDEIPNDLSIVVDKLKEIYG